MHKAKALRLKPGDVIMYGHSQWSAEVRAWLYGRVKKVTENGGILVGVLGSMKYCAFDPHAPERYEDWVPYNHVWPEISWRAPKKSKFSWQNAFKVPYEAVA